MIQIIKDDDIFCLLTLILNIIIEINFTLLALHFNVTAILIGHLKSISSWKNNCT